MYKKIKLLGFMFHHFHDEKKNKKSEGSIDKKKFKQIIKNFKTEIINPNEFKEIILEKKKIKKRKICLTFDDGIAAQADVAAEVLDDLNLKAFFFVNSQQFEKKVGMLECCRYFRNNYFKSIEEFNKFFLQKLDFFYPQKNLKKFLDLNKNKIKKMKKLFSFYSNKDIQFRIVRDYLLNNDEYILLLTKLFKLKKFNFKQINFDLFLNKKNLKKLSNNGHEIGLHSHSHPIPITKLSHKNIHYEYFTNKKILEKITNIKINSVSYPNGYTNIDCEKILNKIGINFGFANNYKEIAKLKFDQMYIPRVDHTELI